MRHHDPLSIRTTNRRAQSFSTVNMAKSMDMTLPNITARHKRRRNTDPKVDDSEFLRDDEQCPL